MSQHQRESARRDYRTVKTALDNERRMSAQFLSGSRREAKLAELDDALAALNRLGVIIGAVFAAEEETQQASLLTGGDAQ